MSDPADSAPADPEPTRSRESQAALDHSLTSGLAWTGAAKWGAQLVTWASTLLVARLLTPEDYGLVGYATLFLGLVEMVTEFGISTAVVKMRDLTPSQLRQLNVLAYCLGGFGFLLTIAASGVLSDFFAAPDLPPVLIVTGTAFIFNSAKSVPEALLRRALRFRLVAVVEASRALITGMVALTMAFMGYGYWALVFSHVAGVAFGALAILHFRRVSFRRPRFADISEALFLSRDMIVGRLAWYVYANSDFLMVGKILGQAALGTYTLGWTLASIPVNKITAIVGKVVGPVFSAVQHEPAELRRYLLNITEGLALIAFPLTIGLSLVAGEFVEVILDEQWLPAIGPLRLLSVYATLRTIQPLLPQLLIITGDANYQMKLSLASAIVLPVGFFIGSGYGPEGVAWAWILLNPLLILPALLRLRKTIHLTLLGYLGAMRPALLGCLVMAAAVLGTKIMVGSLDGQWRLGLMIAAGAIAYLGTVFSLFGSRIMSLRRGLKPISS